MQYLLPCQCGQKTPVSKSQAGETVRCACGQLLDVPTLRGMRDLPTTADPPASRSAAGQPFWSLGMGLMFVAGVTLALGALISLGMLTIYISGLPTEPPELLSAEESRAKMSEMTPGSLWDEWTKLRDLEQYPLTQPFEPEWVAGRARRRLSVIVMFIAGGVMILGIVMAGAAILQGGKQARQ